MDNCCMSSEEKESYRIHKEIERQLRKDRVDACRTMKMLLLGTGESGKHTICKQLRIIYGKGYSEEDRRDFTRFVFQNVFTAVQTLIHAMETLNTPFTDDKNTKYAAMLSKVNTNAVNSMEPDHAEAIKRVWSDHGIQQCYERRREFQLLDSAKYFLDDMDRISSAFYLPTDQDILRVRKRFTGISEYGIPEYIFELSPVIFRVINFNGYCMHPKLRCYILDDVQSVIFVVAISEYDQVLPEDASVSRMSESKALFKSIINNRWFKYSHVILFLNKTDLLQEKISKYHLADYFPQYQGPKNDAEAAKKFILTMYEEQNVEHEHIYSHYTCATDTENIRFTFKAVRDTITRTHLKSYNLS
ncbi:guanine nucleotide-binding protein subunit alpha-14-like [Salminus brasiliensis]|uniref:guanine nucleotide-binding protein subunit alpha-14-like n=1 Tax=Salminus brasiliensis TaxID=930266 RepID=UPI003B82CA2E